MLIVIPTLTLTLTLMDPDPYAGSSPVDSAKKKLEDENQRLRKLLMTKD